jgi:hypothetical protein
MFQNSELCLPVFGHLIGGRGGAKTQSVTTNMHTKEVFDKTTFNKASTSGKKSIG